MAQVVLLTVRIGDRSRRGEGEEGSELHDERMQRPKVRSDEGLSFIPSAIQNLEPSLASVVQATPSCLLSRQSVICSGVTRASRVHLGSWKDVADKRDCHCIGGGGQKVEFASEFEAGDLGKGYTSEVVYRCRRLLGI